jgi:hypothetical protein
VALHKEPKSDLAVASEIGNDLDERLGRDLAKLNVATLTQRRDVTGASTLELVAAQRAKRTGKPLHFPTRFLRPRVDRLATLRPAGEVA